MHLLSDVCVHVCAHMHVVLDLGLWCISAEETRGPCGPLMGMELSNHGGMLQGTRSECIPLEMLHTQLTHTWKVTNIYISVQKNTQTKFVAIWYAHAFQGKFACDERMQIHRPHLCYLYILLGHAGFLEATGLWGSWGPELSFVEEPRGPRRGWLEHTWKFEPLGRSAGITLNCLWRLAVSLRLEMVCCCALCIGRSSGSRRGRKGFFRNHWGGW